MCVLIRIIIVLHGNSLRGRHYSFLTQHHAKPNQTEVKILVPLYMERPILLGMMMLLSEGVRRQLLLELRWPLLLGVRRPILLGWGELFYWYISLSRVKGFMSPASTVSLHLSCSNLEGGIIS